MRALGAPSAGVALGLANRCCLRCEPVSFPVAEAAYERLLTLPLHAGMEDGDVDDVVAALDKVAAEYLVS